MIRFVFGIVIGALAILFAMMNPENVQVQLFFWTVTMSRAVMLLVVLGIGIIVGGVLVSTRRR